MFDVARPKFVLNIYNLLLAEPIAITLVLFISSIDDILRLHNEIIRLTDLVDMSYSLRKPSWLPVAMSLFSCKNALDDIALLNNII
jgi:hypothetical protein